MVDEQEGAGHLARELDDGRPSGGHHGRLHAQRRRAQRRPQPFGGHFAAGEDFVLDFGDDLVGAPGLAVAVVAVLRLHHADLSGRDGDAEGDPGQAVAAVRL